MIGIQSLLWGQQLGEPTLDPSIHYARLKNGFSYYIKPMSGTGGKIGMELILKAGSRHEDDKQYGMAHFLEHMPFVQTEHFDNIVGNSKLLGELNMKTTDIRGITGGNKTRYHFDFPAGNTKAFQTGLRFFHDIASGGIKFNKEDVNGERGVVFQEYLMGNSSSLYVTLKEANLVSNCIEQVYTTKEFQEHLENFPIADLKRFYKEWYRPDLMAIVIVGNIENPNQVEKQIRKVFSDINKPNRPIPKLTCQKEYHEAPNQFKIITDPHKKRKEKSQEIVFHFFVRTNPKDYPNLARHEYRFMKKLTFNMLQNRLRNAEKRYNIPYDTRLIQARLSFVPAFKLEIKTPRANQREAVQEIFSLIHEFREKGASQKEFNQAQKNILEDQQVQSAMYWSKSIEAHFTKNEPLPKNKPKRIRNKLENFSLEKFNKTLKDYLPKMPEDIVVVLSPGSTWGKGEKRLRRWISNAQTNNYVHEPMVVPEYLLSQKEKEGLSPVSLKYIGDGPMKDKQYVLKNGAKVIVKSFLPASGRYQDKIMIHGFSRHGAASLPQKQQMAARLAPQILKHMGVGGFNKFQLDAFLKSKGIVTWVKPYIKSYESGFKIEVEPEQLETAMQLIYLYMEKPRWDKKAFADWKTSEQENYIQKMHEYGVKPDFLDEIRKEIGITTYNPKATKHYKATKKVSLRRAKKAYRSLMQNPKEFTFIITGNFQENKIRLLVETYLANLKIFVEAPALPEVNPKAIQLPKRPFKSMYEPSQDIGNVLLHQSYIQQLQGPEQKKEEMERGLLSYILINRLHELRYENKRAVYFAVARTHINLQDRYRLINFIIEVDPKDLKAVQADLKEIIEEIKTKGITDRLFKVVMESYMYPRYSRKNQTENKHIQNSLYHYYRYEVPITPQEKLDQLLQSITISDVPRIAKKYLDESFLVEFIAKNKH